MNKNSNEFYEIKRIPIDDLNENEMQENQEIINMNLLNGCKNSIKFFGYFQDEDFIYLIMELCDCI